MTAAAALAYATLGWRVLPCEPAGKRPILSDWPTRATSDPSLIERWFRRTPGANLAVAPGSGIFVLDIDGPEGERALVDLEHRHGEMPELYPMQWTGGGRAGWQAFFAYAEGRTIGNSAGRLGPKLDTRGAGGYVLVPPSVTAEPYRWAENRDLWTISPEPAPTWLVDLLDPPAAPEPEHRQAFSTLTWRPATGPDCYSLKALEAELALVAMAPIGGRNDQVWSSSKSLFRLVRDGRLSADIVARGLLEAARHTGCGTDQLCRENCRRRCRAEDAITRAAQKRGVALR